jgi:hypothetical protein
VAYTDHNRASGDGTLKIRDYGGTVEFWVQAGYDNFHWENLSFSYTANGVTRNVDYDYPLGGDWKRVASVVVNTSQTVTFRLLESTGTQSLAGPTTFSVALDRDTVPAAPDPPTFSSVGSTSVMVSFTDNSNGGASIDSRQIGYRKDTTTAPLISVSSDGSTLITGLTPGHLYYFWARVHNYKGWSSYSSSRSVVMLSVPPAPSSPVLSAITQNSLHAVFSGNGTGGTPVIEWQLGYGTDPITPTDFISQYNTDLVDLDPGKIYYFWARGRNSVGWGPWSAVSSAMLIAGASVKVDLVWKRAVPYVKVDGVWKVARPWSRLSGAWRETIQ